MRKFNYVAIMMLHSFIGGGGIGFFGSQTYLLLTNPDLTLWPDMHPLTGVGFTLLFGVFYWVSRKWASNYYFWRKAELIVAWSDRFMSADMTKFAKDGRTPVAHGKLRAEKNYDHAPDCDCGEPDSQMPDIKEAPRDEATKQGV